MSYIDTLIESFGPHIRPSHPTLYDALHVCTGLYPIRSYLEIGVHDGASLLAVLRSAPELSRVVLCDVERTIGDLPTRAEYHGSLVFLHGDSYDLIPQIHETFDLILVDGDHSYTYALADIRNSVPLLAPCGQLVIDDSTRPEIRSAIKWLEANAPVVHFFDMTDEQDSVSIYRRKPS